MTQRGAMRHRVKLQSSTLAADAAGGNVQTWADVATIWAAITPLSGQESFTAQQFAAKVSHWVLIPYRSGVTAQMRLLYGARAFNIQSVVNVDERNHVLKLLCEERSREQ